MQIPIPLISFSAVLWMSLTGLCPGAAAAAAAPVAALRSVYQHDFLVGVAVGPYVYQGNDPAIGGLVAKHFNSLTCENAMKWSSLNPAPGKYTFEVADRLVGFARQHGMQVVGHTLVWHQQTPAWVFEGADGKPATRDVMLDRMRAHISAVAGHYRGKLLGWDVVNEAVAGGGGFVANADRRAQ